MSNQRLLLENFYLFKDWSPSDLEKVSHLAKAETYLPGDEVFGEGDAAVYLYIVKYGSVRLGQKSKSDNLVDVTVLGTGAHFGEMPYLDGEARSGTVIAIERTEIISVAYADLRAFLDLHSDAAIKFYRALATFLCGRLRVTTMDLDFSREKNLRHF